MQYETPETREAYRQGARDAYESAFAGLRTGEARMLEDWLTDLEAWQDGDPPSPPYVWE